MEVYGFAGKMGAGKNTAAELLKGYLQSQGKSVAIMAYADRLKEIVADIFAFSNEQVYGGTKNIVDPRYNITPREAMQKFGTEYIRHLVPNFWVEHLMSQLDDREDGYGTDVVFITDVRFINEALAIQERGGKIFNIERGERNEFNGGHISENIDVNPDICVDNNGSFIDLGMAISKAYESLRS